MNRTEGYSWASRVPYGGGPMRPEATPGPVTAPGLRFASSNSGGMPGGLASSWTSGNINSILDMLSGRRNQLRDSDLSRQMQLQQPEWDLERERMQQNDRQFNSRLGLDYGQLLNGYLNSFMNWLR